MDPQKATLVSASCPCQAAFLLLAVDKTGYEFKMYGRRTYGDLM